MLWPLDAEVPRVLCLWRLLSEVSLYILCLIHTHNEGQSFLKPSIRLFHIKAMQITPPVQ